MGATFKGEPEWGRETLNWSSSSMGSNWKEIVFGVWQPVYTAGGLIWFKNVSVQKC